MSDSYKISGDNSRMDVLCGACGSRRSAADPDCGCQLSPSRRGDGL